MQAPRTGAKEYKSSRAVAMSQVLLQGLRADIKNLFDYADIDGSSPAFGVSRSSPASVDESMAPASVDESMTPASVHESMAPASVDESLSATSLLLEENIKERWRCRARL